jgi:cell division transport system permease protein
VISLRPSRFDELGLRRALSDRMVPLLVAAMAFLAALALAGWFGTAALSRHWQQGAGASLTVQVPQATDPSAQPGPSAQSGQTRLAAVLALLTGTPGVASAHALSDQELADLLRPWLGQGAERLAVPIPAVIAVRLTDSAANLAPLTKRLDTAAPGTLVEDHGVWIRRLAVLARSLQACAGLALLLVAGVAAAVIAVATRAGLSTRREAIEIVHGLGATDRYIAGRFAARATLLAAVGAAGGAVAALPILLALAHMAAPFAGDAGTAGDTLGETIGALPPALWLALPCLPAGAAAIGYATAHGAVRRWLRRLP